MSTGRVKLPPISTNGSEVVVTSKYLESGKVVVGNNKGADEGTLLSLDKVGRGEVVLTVVNIGNRETGGLVEEKVVEVCDKVVDFLVQFEPRTVNFCDNLRQPLFWAEI